MIAGKYRVERILGVGGMGVVVAASHLGLGQSVAIKLMLPELAASSEFTARFIREARAAAAIRGEHVVRVFDVAATEDGTLYMVMELLEGDDLSQLGKLRGALPIEEAVDYLLQACDALAEAHALGIVHRDLKPGNLFLARGGGGPPILKVLDFGISKSSNLDAAQGGAALTAAESMLGSPYYMSPEQFRSSKNVDARSDIWSLGLILHQLITGFPAFESESIGEHLSMIAADPPSPLRLRRPDAPEELEAIVLRCLEKDAGRRFQNIGQLAVALAPFASPGSERLLNHLVTLLGAEAFAPLARPSVASEATATGPAPRTSLDATPAAADQSTATTATSSVARLPARPLSRWLVLAGAAILLAVTLAGALAFRDAGGHRVPAGEPLPPAAPSTVSLPEAPPATLTTAEAASSAPSAVVPAPSAPPKLSPPGGRGRPPVPASRASVAPPAPSAPPAAPTPAEPPSRKDRGPVETHL